MAYLAVLAFATGCPPADFVEATDADGDGWIAGDAIGWDCHDDNADAYPGHPERCIDGLDNDCDGRPDGAALPVLDPLLDGQMDEAWHWQVGAASDLSADELNNWAGLRPGYGPLVFARDPGAQCWTSVRLTAGWVFEEDATFSLEMILMAGLDWPEGEERPPDGYVFRWERDGSEETGWGTQTFLYRRNDGRETLLNRGTWEVPYEIHSMVPVISADARVHDELEATEISLYLGREQTMPQAMRMIDTSEDRLTHGGVAVGFGEGKQEGVLTGVYIDDAPVR